MYCQLPADYLPSPEAALITGITPQKAMQEGLSEPKFIAKIHAELSKPKTTSLGYNSIRFDDEVTRYTCYRNFIDHTRGAGKTATRVGTCSMYCVHAMRCVLKA